ncbi:MAG TPA: TIGR04053 family radical SAM/SPASM domain-containing protein [Bryobacteraceae bacterium]|jgi:radical SAM protein|nr:TIGR04053 family radical SAM/SPASM domain-containing protein [Bryobacteraceae bacterium]
MRDFSESPMLLIWELTQACDLACRHCRASAQPDRNEAELSTGEAYRVLDQIRELGNPLVVLTGGDPLKRPDLFNIIERSVGLGLRTTVTPSATPLLTPAAVARFKDCGVSRMAVSLDGPDKSIHDGFRGVAGSFARTMAALHFAGRIGLETQINTTVSRHNVGQLGRIAQLVADSKARLWSVFFLVLTGRAQLEDDLTAEEYEQVFELLYNTSLIAPFDIKTTEAPHYRRFHAQQRKRTGAAPASPAASLIQRQAGINDGKGLLFVSHTGEIFPSGFLELSAGNVRTRRLEDAYRNSQLFQVIRDADRIEGKCGFCDYRNLCGGSRSRALALTGNFMASDPRCVYQPPARNNIKEMVR